MNRQSGLLILVLGLAAGFVHAGEAREFLYTAGHTANQVWGFSVDPETGALEPVPGVPVRCPRVACSRRRTRRPATCT